MKNILIMLDYYLPHASANGVCVEAIVKEFEKSGASVTLLTLSDTSSCQSEGNLTIHTFAEPPRKRDIPVLSSLAVYLKWLLPSKYPITNRRALSRAYVREAGRILREKQIDTLVCVHLPTETLVAASELRREFPDLEMIAYMLDSMSGGHVPHFLPQKFTRWRKSRWEKRLFAPFNRIVVMETSRPHHESDPAAAAWLGKATFLNVPLLARRSVPEREVSPSQKTRIAFCGLLDFPYRNVFYLLNVLRHMQEDVEVVLVGRSNVADRIRQEAGERVIYRGQLSHGEVQEIIEQSDILLNFGVRTPSAISGKIFEYMSYGKPIISTYSIDDEACLPYLARYPMSLVLDERETDVLKQAAAMDAFIRETKGRTVDPADVEREFYTSTPRAFCELLLLK